MRLLFGGPSLCPSTGVYLRGPSELCKGSFSKHITNGPWNLLRKIPGPSLDGCLLPSLDPCAWLLLPIKNVRGICCALYAIRCSSLITLNFLTRKSGCANEKVKGRIHARQACVVVHVAPMDPVPGLTGRPHGAGGRWTSNPRAARQRWAIRLVAFFFLFQEQTGLRVPQKRRDGLRG